MVNFANHSLWVLSDDPMDSGHTEFTRELLSRLCLELEIHNKSDKGPDLKEDQMKQKKKTQ